MELKELIEKIQNEEIGPEDRDAIIRDLAKIVQELNITAEKFLQEN